MHDVCLVIGPEHDSVRRYYDALPLSRVRIHFAVQQSPRGTADAVAAAEEFAAGQSFIVINSDNYYPAEALDVLHAGDGPATIGFDRDALVHLGNVPADRVERFGAMDIAEDGALRRILARPTAAMQASGAIYASLNCWRFSSAIFAACRSVPPSARGEFELPQAVQLAIDAGMRVEVKRVRAAALDMSSRGDIASVVQRLRDVPVLL